MQRTLFLIPVPDQFLGLPIVGFGWLLIVWLLISVAWIAVVAKRKGSLGEALGNVPLCLVIAAAIVFVLPVLRVQEAGQVGFPVRGYGVLLVFGIVSAVGLAAHRAQRMGVNPEIILSLAMVLIISGIAGARTFFVIQYWETFYVPGDLRATLFNVLQVTEGGIVVYGSLIGAAIGFTTFCIIKKLPALALADLIAPSLMIGMFFGRIGCLLNGCCYGGLCDLPVAVTFPQNSPPYARHMENGAFFGVLITPDTEGKIRIGNILPNSPAAENGKLEIGDTIEKIDNYSLYNQTDPESGDARPPMQVASSLLSHYSWSPDQTPHGQAVIKVEDKEAVTLSIADPPARSLPVHPTQLYSSLNGLILCLLALSIYPFRRHDGQIIAATLGIYAVTRFLLEVIRTDEYAIGGTGLTISQNVSVVIILLAVGLFIFVKVKNLPVAWPKSEA